MYLANTLNLEDFIVLMKKYPEFNDTVHFSVDGIPIEDVKEIGMEATNKQIAYKMDVSEATVKLHINALLRAVGATNRTQAVIIAQKMGLI